MSRSLEYNLRVHVLRGASAENKLFGAHSGMNMHEYVCDTRGKFSRSSPPPKAELDLSDPHRRGANQSWDRLESVSDRTEEYF